MSEFLESKIIIIDKDFSGKDKNNIFLSTKNDFKSFDMEKFELL
jgi:hypothetical protein